MSGIPYPKGTTLRLRVTLDEPAIVLMGVARGRGAASFMLRPPRVVPDSEGDRIFSFEIGKVSEGETIGIPIRIKSRRMAVNTYTVELLDDEIVLGRRRLRRGKDVLALRASMSVILYLKLTKGMLASYIRASLLGRIDSKPQRFGTMRNPGLVPVTLPKTAPLLKRRKLKGRFKGKQRGALDDLLSSDLEGGLQGRSGSGGLGVGGIGTVGRGAGSGSGAGYGSGAGRLGGASRPKTPEAAMPVAAAPAPHATRAKPRESGPKAEPPTPQFERSAITVWYGTNRKPVDENPDNGYTGERGDKTHFGRCRVFIPRSHKIGQVGSVFWKRWLTLTDDRLRLLRTTRDSEDVFWQKLAARIKQLDRADRHALVFLHGYNVDFKDAAVRCAQIGHDLQVRGPVAFFSWPSRGSLFGYSADEASIEASEDEIAEFLTRIAQFGGAERIHVIAHSMGNRGLLRAITRIVGTAQAGTRAVRFGQFILAAPDVDVELFSDLYRSYLSVAARTTLYVSERDVAVDLSKALHAYHRVGFAPPITVVDGIDTVNVTGVDLSLLGHGYVAEAREVLGDMHQLVRFSAPPDKRMGLREQRTPQGKTYWEIRR